ncbi:MAG: DUF2282 domain-containing protein [Thiotrichaceae bacterium]|nr:DUF2282 domain-containing protein [Thiotrichaceae bacterium]
MNNKNLIKSALTSVMAVGLVTASSAAMAGKPGMEKCMGVAAAGKNDCGTSQHACAGMAKTDSMAEEWVYVPTGSCEKLTGGKVKPAKKAG